MDRIFNMDNKFFTGLNKIVDIIWLNFLMLLFCLPIFTISSTMAAVYYTVHKQIIHNRGYVWDTFYGAFKANFKNCTPTWLLQQLFLAVLALDTYLSDKFLNAGSKWGILIVFFVVLFIAIIVWALYCSFYFARFEQTRKTGRRNAALIAIANLPWSFLVAVLALGTALIIYVIPISLFLVPVLFVMIIYMIMERIFHKLMDPEDIAREEEEFRKDMID